MLCCCRYRTRPSLLLSAARLAGFSLGAAATAAPPPIRAAVLGAVQDALTEQYNEHLRALREAGLSEEVRPLCRVVKGGCLAALFWIVIIVAS
jgi:demethoxyubiquinone hydroxylase (CLK1/Coq7/Cat5 family)